MTLSGPVMRNGMDLERRIAGGASKAQMRTLVDLVKPGSRADSEVTVRLVKEAVKPYQRELTMVTDQLNRSSMLGDAERMVLHAWTASNISQDQHLSRHIALSRRVRWSLVAGGEEEECSKGQGKKSCPEQRQEYHPKFHLAHKMQQLRE